MKIAVKDLIGRRGNGQLTELNMAKDEHAAAAETARVEIIVSDRKYTCDDFRTAALNAQLTFGLVYGECANADEAKRAAFEGMDAGADSILCPMRCDAAEAMAEEAIPVVGYIGFMPKRAHWTGRAARGKTVGDALAILNDARHRRDTGGFCGRDGNCAARGCGGDFPADFARRDFRGLGRGLRGLVPDLGRDSWRNRMACASSCPDIQEFPGRIRTTASGPRGCEFRVQARCGFGVVSWRELTGLDLRRRSEQVRNCTGKLGLAEPWA